MLKILDNCQSYSYKVFGVYNDFHIFFFFFFTNILQSLLERSPENFRIKYDYSMSSIFLSVDPSWQLTVSGETKNPPKTFETNKVPIDTPDVFGTIRSRCIRCLCTVYPQSNSHDVTMLPIKPHYYIDLARAKSEPLVDVYRYSNKI